MKILSSIIITIFLILVSACSNEKAVVQKKPSQGQKLSEDNVFKGYESPLDKAEGVEQIILDTADRRRKEIEEQGY